MMAVILFPFFFSFFLLQVSEYGWRGKTLLFWLCHTELKVHFAQEEAAVLE